MAKKKDEKKGLPKEMRVERVLVENFIALQKVMTNLSIKFDRLSDRIDKLLELFEISAKALAEKEYGSEKGNKDNEKIIKKIDNLFEQNKIIARGLSLLHENGSESEIHQSTQKQTSPSEFYRQNLMQASEQPDINQYQKSISSAVMAPKFKNIPRD